MEVLIGGYTMKQSQGIYELSFNSSHKPAQLEEARNIIKVSGPTYFQISKKLLFTIDKPNDKEGGISSYKLIDGRYEKQDHFYTPGSSPAYLGINSKEKLLYTANYHTGVLSIFKYDEQGKLNLLTSITHTAQTLGPRPEQIDGAHPHFFDQTPAGNLVSCDLGNDSVDFYRADKTNKLKHLATYKNEAGFGSRHLVFSNDGQYFYVTGELSSKVNVVKFNEQDWSFENIATYSTIPEDWKQHNGAAAIKISSDGQFIYISNRGNDSIVVFQIQDDHTLRLVQRVSTFGSFPRDFNWDESEKYVVVANQTTDNATLYSRNPETGCLTVMQKNIRVPEGTRVLFKK